MTLSERLASLFLFIVLMIPILAACEPADRPSETLDLPPKAVLEAQAWLAQRLNVPVEEVQIVNVEQAEWTDACLELSQSDEVCAEVITPGWQAIFQVDGQEYEVHTDVTGEVIRSPQITSEK